MCVSVPKNPRFVMSVWDNLLTDDSILSFHAFTLIEVEPSPSKEQLGIPFAYTLTTCTCENIWIYITPVFKSLLSLGHLHCYYFGIIFLFNSGLIYDFFYL